MLLFFRVILCFWLGFGFSFCSAEPSQTSEPIYVVNGFISDVTVATADADVKTITNFNSNYNRYTDNAYGYSLLYPNSMQIDASLSAVRSVLFNDTTKIEIYYDDFSNSQANARDYIFYGNHCFSANRSDHIIEEDSTLYLNGMKVHYLQWSRRKLTHVPEDKNHYISAEFVKNNYEVYTIFIKSSLPIDNGWEIVKSFRLTEQHGTAGIYRNKSLVPPRVNAETQALYNKYFAKSKSVVWGVFEPSAPEFFTYLIPLEETMDYSFDFLIRYHTLEEKLPVYGLNKAYENRKYVELTMQTLLPGVADALKGNNKPDDNAGIVYAILDGQYDGYLNDYAQRMKEFGHPVLFRLNNEMNGDWCWYSAYYTGKDTDVYIALWKYIHRVFDANGVDNVLWVWNPHDVSRPNFKWNDYLLYYPGDEYVDIIGMTGYNTGTYFPGEEWREFEDIYRPLYSSYNHAFSQPFMISEFGSNSVGGDKPAWINRMFDNIGQFNNIKVAIWWSGIDYDSRNYPGRIYLINEDEPTIKAFRDRLPAYKPKPDTPIKPEQVQPLKKQ